MRKKLRVLFLLPAVSLLFISCSKNTPKEVATVWLTGFNRMDFEQSMKLSTPETKNLLNSLQELTENVSDSAKTALAKVTVSIKDVKEEGDKAVVTYTSSDNPTEEKLNLVKQNDKWLVMFTKTDLVGVMPTDDGESSEQPAVDSTAAPADSAK